MGALPALPQSPRLNLPPSHDHLFVERGRRRPRGIPPKPPLPVPIVDARDRDFARRSSFLLLIFLALAISSLSPEAPVVSGPTQWRPPIRPIASRRAARFCFSVSQPTGQMLRESRVMPRMGASPTLDGRSLLAT